LKTIHNYQMAKMALA